MASVWRKVQDFPINVGTVTMGLRVWYLGFRAQEFREFLASISQNMGVSEKRPTESQIVAH